MAMGVGLRGCVRRDSNESVIHYLHDADARVFIRAETAKQPFVQIAALVKVGSLPAFAALSLKVRYRETAQTLQRSLSAHSCRSR